LHKNQEDFLLLDLDAVPEERFRHNLLEVLNIDDFVDGKSVSMLRKKIDEDNKPNLEEKKEEQQTNKSTTVVHKVEY